MTSAHPIEDVRIFHKECVSLAKAGYDVYLVERGDSYEKNGVHIVGVGDIPRNRIKRMISGAKMVFDAAVLIDADIYHFHDPELLPFGIKLKKLGKKVVFDSHELTRQQIAVKPYLPAVIARAASWVYAKYENRVLKTIDGIVFPCLINDKYPLPGRNKVLLNNLPRLEELYDKYNENEEKLYDVGMAGSLTYNRGITHMIHAINSAGCTACIGGNFDSKEYEDEIKRMASDKIAFPGYLNREQVLDLVQKTRVGCSVLLNIGQYANMGNLSTKVYEFMSMAVPVIISDTPYNVAMVEKYKFGLCVDPENITEYKDAIRFLLDNPDIAKELGMNGRHAVKETFNWEKEFQNLLSLYETILGDSVGNNKSI